MLAIDPDRLPVFFLRVVELSRKGDSFAQIGDKLGRGFARRSLPESELCAFLARSVTDGSAGEPFIAWWNERAPAQGAVVPKPVFRASPPTLVPPPPPDKERDAIIETRVQDATRKLREELNTEKRARSEAESAVQTLSERVDALEGELGTVRARARVLGESTNDMTTEIQNVRATLVRKERRIADLEEELRRAASERQGLEAKLRMASGAPEPTTSRDTWGDAVRASQEAAPGSRGPRASTPREKADDEITAALALLVRRGQMTVEEAIAKGRG